MFSVIKLIFSVPNTRDINKSNQRFVLGKFSSMFIIPVITCPKTKQGNFPLLLIALCLAAELVAEKEREREN